MGCDIHVLTEKKYSKGWFNCDYWQKEYDDQKYHVVSIYRTRSYDLFAILANVRNGPSLFEILDGNADKAVVLPYISEAKGIPEDLDKTTKEVIDYWGTDGHSHSYFTVKELYNYWKKMPQTVKCSGVLVGQVLKDFDARGILPSVYFVAYRGKEPSAYRVWEVEYNPLDTFMDAVLQKFEKEMWLHRVDRNSEEYNRRIEEKGDDFRVVFFFDN